MVRLLVVNTTEADIAGSSSRGAEVPIEKIVTARSDPQETENITPELDEMMYGC